jgi:hypothetical protein
MLSFPRHGKIIAVLELEELAKLVSAIAQARGREYDYSWEFSMTHNDVLHWLILGFGLAATDDDLGRPTDISQLWQDAKEKCFDCERDEVLDALYTLPREYAALIKFVSAGEGFHPVSFERVRNTRDWTDYFLIGNFNVKVLPEGKVRYEKLSEQLGKTAADRIA